MAEGALDPGRAEMALRDQARSGIPLGRLLTDRRWVDEQRYAEAVSAETGWPLLESQPELDPALAERAGVEACEKGELCPMAWAGRRVRVAVVEPDEGPLDGLRFRFGAELVPRVTTRSHLDRLQRHLFFGEALEARSGGKGVPGEARDAIHRLVNENRVAARAVRAIFDLCVERGLIEPGALEARLQSTPPPE